jgi:hypothetical protein
MIRYSRIKILDNPLTLDGSWKLSSLSPITGQSSEKIDIHNTSDGTENGTYSDEIIDTLNIGDDATVLNAESELTVEAFLKNIIVDKIPPSIISENNTYVGINAYSINLSLFEKYGISYRTIRISYCSDLVINPDTAIYTCIFDGTSTKELKTEYGKYISSFNLERNNSNYTLSFLLDNTIGYIAQNGLKIEIYDYAGNGIIFYNDKSFFTIKTIDFIPVEISFSNIEPTSMYVTSTEVGKCKVTIYNPEYNKSLWGSNIIARLTSDSVGTIIKDTMQLTKLNSNDSGVNLLTFEVDNITSTGSVIVEAWVDIGGTDALKTSIKEATYNIATLGTWISECVDNSRKLNFKQYVPKYLAEDTEIYQFVSFIEDFFNTIYTEDNCNISILEKIDRIKRLYDINKLDNKYLGYYGDIFGKELDLNLDQVKNLLNVTNVTDEILFKYIRTLYKTIPYINQYKGTNAAIIIILKCFGCLPILIEKWISRTVGDTSMVEVEQNSLEYKKQTSYFDPRYYYQYDKLRDYYLSSHFSIDLGYDNKTIEEVEKSAPTIYKLITRY